MENAEIFKKLEEQYGVDRAELEVYIEFIKSLDVQQKAGLRLLLEGLKQIKKQ